MAENKDTSAKSDEQKLADLEKQLTDKAAKEKLGGETAAKQKASSKAPAAEPNKKITLEEKSVVTETSKKVTQPTKTATAPAGNSSAPAKTAKPAEKKAKTGLLWLVTILNLVVLLLLIGAAYWGWQQWQGQAQGLDEQKLSIENQKQQQQAQQQEQSDYFSTQQKIIEQAVASSQFAKDDLERQYRALESTIENLQEQIQIAAQQAEANKRNMSELTGRRPSDWLIAEADYLVGMAGRKLWLEHDDKTALSLLQAADSRLQELDDPSLLPVRQQLAVDIQNVQQIKAVSYSSIALSVSGLIPQVDGLMLAFFERPDINQATGEVSESVDDWRTNLSNNLKEVTKNFFSYKKITAEVKPFMSEQQQWLSKEQLKFALMSAQIAILKEDAQLFRNDMQRAIDMLAEYFDSENQAVMQFNSSLTELLNTDIERVYPERFLVTNPLKNLIDSRLNSRFSSGDQ